MMPWGAMHCHSFRIRQGLQITWSPWLLCFMLHELQFWFNFEDNKHDRQNLMEETTYWWEEWSFCGGSVPWLICTTANLRSRDDLKHVWWILVKGCVVADEFWFLWLGPVLRKKCKVRVCKGGPGDVEGQHWRGVWVFFLYGIGCHLARALRAEVP